MDGGADMHGAQAVMRECTRKRDKCLQPTDRMAGRAPLNSRDKMLGSRKMRQTEIIIVEEFK